MVKKKRARPGPTETESQATGRMGCRAFEAHYPEAWLPGESKPGTDFGFDYNVQFKKQSRIRWTFRVQLKATASDETFGETAEHFEVRVHRDTCNLYAGSAEPVMLVACDLRAANGQPAHAKLYFAWIHDEITERLRGRKLFDGSDPEHLMFKVPKSQALTTGLDVGSYLEDHASRNRDLAAIRKRSDASGIRTLSQLRAPSFQTIGQLGAKRLAAVLEGADRQDPDWEVSDPSSAKARIQELRHAVTAGNDVLAERLIGELKVFQPPLTTLEQAETAYQTGRHRLSMRDPIGATKAWDEAMALAPSKEKYAGAGLEMHIIDAELKGDRKKLRSLLRRIPANSKYQPLVSLRARIFSRLGEREAFLKALKPLKDVEAIKSRMLGELALGNEAEVIRLSRDAEQLKPLPRDEHFIRVLRVRALLHQVIPIPKGAKTSRIIPPAGEPGLDLERARIVLEEGIAALELSQRLSWPSNSELLLDAVGVLAPIFNEQQRILGLIEDFSRKRVAVKDAHVQLERLAVLADNKELALTASERAGSRTVEAMSKRVLVHVEAGQHVKALEVAAQELLPLPDAGDSLRYVALAAASFSALRLGRIEERATLLAAVPNKAETTAILALNEFFASNFEFPARRRENLAKYWAEFEKQPDDAFFQDNIIAQLSSQEPEDYERAHTVIRLIRRRRRLTADETLLECEVLSAQKRYTELDKVTAEALLQYPSVTGVAFYRAVALDSRGQTAAAMQLLEDAVTKTEDANLLKLFAQLAARSGQRERARKLCEQLLQKSDLTRRSQYKARHMLFALISDDGSSQAVETAAWQLGMAADQSDEEEEGVFLAAYMSATTQYRPTDDRLKHVAQRIDAYCNRFPDSRWFRRAEMPKNATGEQLLARLSELVGNDEDWAKRRSDLWQQLQKGDLQAPLSWRPTLVIPGIDNLGQLFAITTRTRRDIRWASVVVTLPNEATLHASETERAKPVFDLVTLLAISELGLWDTIFKLWNVVTIGKATIFELTRTAYAAFDQRGQALLRRAVQAVAANSNRILQPGEFDETEARRFGFDELEAIRAICAEHGTTYCSVDRAARMAINIDAVTECKTINLLDVLELAHARGFLGDEQMLLVRAVIASWNVTGADLSPEDAASFLVGQAVGKTRRDELHEQLTNDSSLCGRFLRSRWRFDVGFDAGVRDVAHIVTCLARQGGSQELCEALLLTWYGMAALHRENKLPPSALLALVFFFSSTTVDGPEHLKTMAFVWRVVRGCWRELTKNDSSGDSERSFREIFTGALARTVHKAMSTLEPIQQLAQEALVRERLFAGLTAGTQEYEDYLDDYLKALKEAAKNQPAKKA